MRQPSQKQLEAQISKFNAKYSVGDRVKVQRYKGDPEPFEDEIYHEATILSGHSAITWLKGKGSYDVECVVGRVQP